MIYLIYLSWLIVEYFFFYVFYFRLAKNTLITALRKCALTPLDTGPKRQINKSVFTPEENQQQHESADSIINNEKWLQVGDIKKIDNKSYRAVNTVSALVDLAESGTFLLKSFLNEKVIKMENKGENIENNGKAV